jgi:putative transposase
MTGLRTGQDYSSILPKAQVRLNYLRVKALFIERWSRWENGYVESFGGKLRDELLNRELFTTLAEAKVSLEQRRKEYNGGRPHNTFNYRSSAPDSNYSANANLKKWYKY